MNLSIGDRLSTPFTLPDVSPLHTQLKAAGLNSATARELAHIAKGNSDISTALTTILSERPGILSARDSNKTSIAQHLESLLPAPNEMSLSSKLLLQNLPAELRAEMRPREQTNLGRLFEYNPNRMDISREQYLAALTADTQREQAKATALSEILVRLAYPTGGTQDRHETCAPASAAIHTNLKDPAEFVRLAKGLLVYGTVATSQGGQLILPTDFGTRDRSTQRSEIDAVMQSAFKNFLADRASGQEYSNQKDQFITRDHTGKVIAVHSAGLYDNEVAHLLAATSRMKHEALEPEQARRLLPHLPTATYVSLAWAGANEPHGHHAVLFKGITSDGRVQFYNPHGGHGFKVGQTLGTPETGGGPIRRSDDPTKGLESMSLEEFLARLDGAVLDTHTLGQIYSDNPALLVTELKALATLPAAEVTSEGGHLDSLPVSINRQLAHYLARHPERAAENTKTIQTLLENPHLPLQLGATLRDTLVELRSRYSPLAVPEAEANIEAMLLASAKRDLLPGIVPLLDAASIRQLETIAVAWLATPDVSPEQSKFTAALATSPHASDKLRLAALKHPDNRVRCESAEALTYQNNSQLAATALAHELLAKSSIGAYSTRQVPQPSLWQRFKIGGWGELVS